MVFNLKRLSALDPHCSIGLRYFASKAKKAHDKKYTNTVLLPKTDFPQWVSANKRLLLDEQILKRCKFNELYSWQNENINGPKFVLHDGPPYANGSPHMGHAVNKVLKDIIIRHKMLMGHKIHYKPGWDCHGLPIELLALKGAEREPLEIRKKAREFAMKTISDQKAVFKTWGLMADWNDHCYYTFDKEYIKNQIQQFFKLYEKGLIYRDMKPVYWSPSSGTALAEAELEYKADHISETIVLRLKLLEMPDIIRSYSNSSPIYLLIWTTTPWTLPANEAVAYNPSFEYALIKTDGNLYIVGKKLVDQLQSKLKKQLEVLTIFSGDALNGATYIHPLRDETRKMLPASYVTDDVGTGLVHTAPSHGPDDYVLALEHKIPIVSYIDEQGRYTAEAGKVLEKSNVLQAGTKKVMDMLCADILIQEKLVHSYPYDWRTKKPVIIRASKQWFIDTKSIKDRAIDLLKNVKIMPEKHVASFIAQLQHRPYWCISRQRSWGVPIPVLYDENENPIISKDSISHYNKLIDENGTDFWWSLPTTDLISPEDLQEYPSKEISKGKDILDIWFDSGLSWSAVLGDTVADLYLEGVDQFTGWFQSSLLTSVALNNRAPFKAILSHGFSVDEQGRKMSKSLGNIIHPYEITHGGVGAKRGSVYGVDCLRWWVASHALQHANIPVSQAMFTNSFESLKKIRNTMKFLLGCIQDLPENYNSPQLYLLDQYMLHKLAEVESKVIDLYESYELNKISLLLLNFITNDVSSFYCHHIKDRVYCEDANSTQRRAAQFTLNEIFHSLLFLFAPILPVLAEEVYQYHPHNLEQKYYFHKEWRRCHKIGNEEFVRSVMANCSEIKEKLAVVKPINLSYPQLSCEIVAGQDYWRYLRALQDTESSTTSELVELLQASEVVLLKSDTVNNFNINVKVCQKHLCERCRKYTSKDSDSICERCYIVVNPL